MNSNLHSTEHWKTVERLFLEALDFPKDEAAQQLLTACNGDVNLFDEVNALLQAHAKTGGILDVFAAEQAALLIDDTEELPMQIGPYAILGKLGEGGMGRVFHAKRDDGQFEREVALKVLRPGLATKTTIQRFLHERQILAKLQHPHIARLLDGGIDEEGHPYFAMDHVNGKPLTEYCNEHNLDLKKRLKLFLDVCDAVQYAHRNLIVHSDLKPSNILVNTVGEVQLLDFGIARILDKKPGDGKTIAGIMAITPEYASPEQVTDKPITTAVDVYTLGIILYELLIDCRPYSIETRSMENIVRNICEVEPPRMSSRFDQLAHHQKESVAQTRSCTAGNLSKQLKGDLDAIALKALPKKPGERYTSVTALSQDIRKYLTGLPVQAFQGNLWYQTKKYVSRHKTGVTITAVLLVSLGFQFLSQQRQSVQIAAERDIARSEAAKAEQIGQYLEGIFTISDPDVNRGKNITARELLAAGTARADEELAGQPEVQAHMQGILGRVYSQLNLLDDSEILLRKSLIQYQHLHGARDSLVAKAHYDLATTLQATTGHTEEAANHFQAALDIQQELYGEQHRNTLNSRIAISLLSHQFKSKENTASLVSTTLDMLTRDAKAISDLTPEKQLEVADLFLFNNTSEKMEEICLNLVTTLDSTKATDQIWLAEAHKSLGQLYMLKKSYDKGLYHYRRTLSIMTNAYGYNHPANTQTRLDIANILSQVKRFDEALDLQQASLEEAQIRLGDDHPQVGEANMMLARIYYRSKQYQESISYYKKALSIFERTEKNSYNISFILKELSYSLSLTNRYYEAEQTIRKALIHSERVFGASNHRTAQINLELSKLLIKRGKANEALPIAQKVLKVRKDFYKPDHYYIGDAHVVVGHAFMILQQFEEAEKHVTESIRIFEINPPPFKSWEESARTILKNLHQTVENRTQ